MQARPWEDNHPVREIGSPAVRRQSIGPPCHGHHDPGRDASRQPKPQGEGPQGILATCSASGSLGNRMCGCPRSFEVRGTVITASLSKEKQDESQQARHGRGRPVSRAPAGGEPGIGSGRRWPATLVARCPHRFLPAVKVPRGAVRQPSGAGGADAGLDRKMQASWSTLVLPGPTCCSPAEPSDNLPPRDVTMHRYSYCGLGRTHISTRIRAQ